MKIIQILDRTLKGRVIRGCLIIEGFDFVVRYDKGYELREGERLESGYIFPPEVNDEESNI